jgi:hypothetical protein
MTPPRRRLPRLASPARLAPSGDFAGPWYAWWPGDPLPALPPLPGFSAAPADDERARAGAAVLAAALL